MSELRLSVVIPARNEEENLPRTVLTVEWALREAGIPHEIIVVDDHSSDGTARVVERLREQCAALRLVPNERSNGFGNAVQTGLDAFEGDAVCIVMADGSDDPADLVRYYRKLCEGYECVFGSRFLPESAILNYPRHKLLLNRAANLFIRLLFRIDYNDVTNAFKCYRRSVIDGLRPILSHHFNLTVELPLKAIVRGYSYAVVPIHWYGRVHGLSKLRIREMGSRYLFIVLYVLLERLLARGDYHRSGAPMAVPGWESAPPRRGLGWAWLGLGAAATLHLLFIYTYPLNHLGGDTVGYHYLLVNRVSNLLFAPGYPVGMSLPLRINFLHGAALTHPAAFHNVLLVAQHAIELAALALLLVALARIYDGLTAALAVFIAGYSPRAMGVTSSVYPEWMQASLLVATLAFALFAFRETSRWRKTALYAGAFTLFTGCVLVKFNAIAFAPGLLAFLLFEKVSWRRRAEMAAIAASAGLLVYLVFVLKFHEPTTGTYALTRDRSWVLMTKLFHSYGNRMPYPEGIATKRWLALSSVLPPDYAVASVGMFLHVDSVPREIREAGRRKAAFLLTANEKVLDDVLRRHRLPPQFHVSVSSLPISYHIGLAESDNLGVQVFRESILHVPGPYLRSVWRNSVATLHEATTEPTFPSADFITGTAEKLVPAGWNRLRLVRLPTSAVPYDSSEPFIWAPGYRFFSRLSHVILTRKRTSLLLALGTLIALWHGLRYGWRLRTTLPLALALLLCGFVVFSNAVLEFRWKEWRLAYPMAATLIGITLGWGIPEAVRAAWRLLRALMDRGVRVS